MQFENRCDAGGQLAARLARYGGCSDAIVLALPRGGVAVGYEIAVALSLPLDVFLVRKLGVPCSEELAMGAIASGGVRVLNDEIVELLGISHETIDEVTQRERVELERRERVYRGDRPEPEVEGRTVILVDDGLATGASMRAAVSALRAQNPARIVVAVGVAPPDTYREFAAMVDEVVAVMTPEPFSGVGAWYRDFSQMTDDEVRSLLERAARR